MYYKMEIRKTWTIDAQGDLQETEGQVKEGHEGNDIQQNTENDRWDTMEDKKKRVTTKIGTYRDPETILKDKQLDTTLTWEHAAVLVLHLAKCAVD